MESNKNKNLPRDFKETFLHTSKSTFTLENYIKGVKYQEGGVPGQKSKKPRLVTPEVPQELERNRKQGGYFDTSQGLPPFSTTNISVAETGNSDPNIVKSTMYVVPHSNYMLERTGIPLALVIHPLNTKSFFYEEDSRSPQCMQCFSYFNPFSKLLQDSKGFTCNICNNTNHTYVPENSHPTAEYRIEETNDASPQRLGIVNEEYFYHTRIKEPLLVFGIELSRITYSTNFYFEALDSIKKVLDDESFSFRRVCFMVFGEELRVLKIKGSDLHEEKIHDFEDLPFASPDIWFDIGREEQKKDLFDLLESYKPTGTSYPLSKTLKFISSIGGFYLGTKVALFLSHVKDEVDSSVYSGMLVDSRVSVNAFSISEDTTIDNLIFATNGRIHIYKNGTVDLYLDLFNLVMEKSVYGASITVKTSDALGKYGIFGNGLLEGANSISISQMDTKSTIAFSFFVDEMLREDQKVYFQVIANYWRVDGTRRALVCNLALLASPSVPLIYNNISFDTVFCTYVKNIVNDAENWKKAIKTIETHIVSTLGYYRKQCCKNASPSHLHLPDSIKLLPSLYQSMCKHPIFNTRVSLPEHKNVLGMSILKTFRYFYPRLFTFSDFFIEQKMDQIKNLRLSYETVDSSEIYVLENGERIFIYFGKDVCEDLRDALRSDEESEERDTLRKIIDELCLEYCSLMPVFFIDQGKGGYEVDFNGYFVEDRIQNCPSYEDFIYDLHYKVKKY